MGDAPEGVLRDVEVEGRRVDVLVRAGRVAAVGPELDGPVIVEGRGGALLPGLVDHHVHLHALAAREASVDAATGNLAAALAAASGDEHGWVRAAGYPGPTMPDGPALDRLHGARPVRLAHHSGAVWTLNRRAAEAVGLASADHPGIERRGEGEPTGRVWRADAWLRARLPAGRPPDLGPTVARLLASGVTAVTDATPDLDATGLAALARAGLRVTALGVPLGASPPSGVGTGPFKLVLGDSGLPGLDELVEHVERAHGAGRAVAVHCVTREALVLLLAALEVAGRREGDRVEHAALVPSELVGELRGLRVVTQPGFLLERGEDYRRDVPAEEHQDLYRLASLLDAGIPVALSSDAPHGPVDPWRVVGAATSRRTPSGVVLGARERVPAAAALRMLLAPPDDPGGPPRRVRPGVPADLVLLRTGLREALAEPDGGHVRLTLLGGRIVAGG